MFIDEETQHVLQRGFTKARVWASKRLNSSSSAKKQLVADIGGNRVLVGIVLIEAADADPATSAMRLVVRR